MIFSRLVLLLMVRAAALASGVAGCHTWKTPEMAVFCVVLANRLDRTWWTYPINALLQPLARRYAQSVSLLRQTASRASFPLIRVALPGLQKAVAEEALLPRSKVAIVSGCQTARAASCKSASGPRRRQLLQIRLAGTCAAFSQRSSGNARGRSGRLLSERDIQRSWKSDLVLSMEP